MQEKQPHLEWVEINTRHLARGVPKDNRVCALTLAVRESFPGCRDYGIVEGSEAEKFIRDFDNYGTCARPRKVQVEIDAVGEDYIRPDTGY